MSHIAVERNRRRQMNDHLKVLRSLTPALYIKRGDQASIIGGAIDFIKELQQVLESLEARKKRRSSSSSSTATATATAGSGGSSSAASHSYSYSYSSTTLSPTTPSPRSHLGLGLSASSCSPAAPPPPAQQTTTELAACCNSPVADVEAKISGSQVLLRTLSRRIPGRQALTMIAMLEALHLEVLHLNISTMEDTVLYSFVLKIGLECQLSVDDLAYEVQQTFVVCSREREQDKLERQDNNLMYSAMAI